MIESRPIPEKTFEYRFFVDIEGNLGDAFRSECLKRAQGGGFFHEDTWKLLIDTKGANMAGQIFAAIDVGSFELEMGIYEMSGKSGIRKRDHIRHVIALGRDDLQ